MRIIGFFGHSGAGKDTLASTMISFGVDAKIYKFAEPLKKMVAEFLGVDYYLVAGFTSESRAFLNKNNPLLMTTSNSEINTPREFMQWLGTDIFRDRLNPDVWTKHLLHRLDETRDVFITDGRFKNTFDSVRSWGGDCVLVTREGLETKSNHPSEDVPYAPEDYDYVIHNDGTIGNLMGKGLRVLGYEKQLPPHEKALLNVVSETT